MNQNLRRDWSYFLICQTPEEPELLTVLPPLEEPELFPEWVLPEEPDVMTDETVARPAGSTILPNCRERRRMLESPKSNENLQPTHT
jgi:hypothetical protein